MGKVVGQIGAGTPPPGVVTPPADPRKDPEVLAMLREMMTIQVGPEEMPSIAPGLMGVVVDGDGVWQIREGMSVSQVTQLGKANLPFTQLGYAEGICIPAPLPVHLLEQTGSLFRWVYQTYKAEAFVRVFWRATAEGGREFHLVVPPQEVSGGGVHHDLSETLEGWIHWGDIHSHAGMDTFWSGTDDADEKRFEGRLFGVMGKWQDPWPSTRWRARLGGQFIALSLDQILGGATLTFRGRVPFAQMLDGGGKVELKGNGVTLFPPEGFPEEWKAQVKESKGYRASEDKRYWPSGGYAGTPAYGRGGNLVHPPYTPLPPAREVGRSEEHVGKLVRRARLLLAGGEKGKTLWAADPSKATWFVDSKLQVWFRPSSTGPLVKATDDLPSLLRTNVLTPASVFLLQEGAKV